MIISATLKNKETSSELIKYLTDNYKFCFSGGIFYILLDVKDESLNEYIEIIDTVNASNYKNITNSLAKDWCESKLEQESLLYFENSEEGQHRLKMIMKYLDAIEKRKEEEVNGKTNEKGNNPTKPRAKRTKSNSTKPKCDSTASREPLE